MVYSEKLVKRYRELYQESPDCLLLMQAGAFMQVMDEDARSVAMITGLKLQMAGNRVARPWRGMVVLPSLFFQGMKFDIQQCSTSCSWATRI
jgi:MutS domain I